MRFILTISNHNGKILIQIAMTSHNTLSTRIVLFAFSEKGIDYVGKRST